MMRKIQFLVIISALSLLVSGCSKSSVASYYKHETECLGVELDGSQTLKAWGKGRNRKDAVEQAKKNAVRDVIFKGNFIGSGECKNQALLLEVNAEGKYESYFNSFFRDGGEYANYVSMEDERTSSSFMRSSDSRNKDQLTYSVVVRVLRVELRNKLIKDGILKQ
ncbi:MAG: hypothetical protein LBH32_12130 [Dysgonamonadaceae bacterium]|jgi:hypothetical protein|nr:hypothetical protein [Dysgonamonadaceae bacterium]